MNGFFGNVNTAEIYREVIRRPVGNAQIELPIGFNIGWVGVGLKKRVGNLV